MRHLPHRLKPASPRHKHVHPPISHLQHTLQHLHMSMFPLLQILFLPVSRNRDLRWDLVPIVKNVDWVFLVIGPISIDASPFVVETIFLMAPIC